MISVCLNPTRPLQENIRNFPELVILLLQGEILGGKEVVWVNEANLLPYIYHEISKQCGTSVTISVAMT